MTFNLKYTQKPKLKNKLYFSTVYVLQTTLPEHHEKQDEPHNLRLSLKLHSVHLLLCKFHFLLSHIPE